MGGAGGDGDVGVAKAAAAHVHAVGRGTARLRLARHGLFGHRIRRPHVGGNRRNRRQPVHLAAVGELRRSTR